MLHIEKNVLYSLAVLMLSGFLKIKAKNKMLKKRNT